MNRLLVSVTFLFTGLTAAAAHPGIGIVVDSKGNIYYTDLKQVWRISPDGTKTVAVANVHTHELSIDKNDNLYGEHLWYEGDRTGRWGHRVWRLAKDGQLANVISAREGFLDDYDDFHFVHDPSGAMYWVDRGEVTAVKKRTADGKVDTVATARFRNVRWMTVTDDGIIYLVDLHDLVRINPDGSVRTVVRNLADHRRSFLLTVEIHAIMGLWTDTAGAVYAAVFSDSEVKKIDPQGHVTIAARSPLGWKPAGGCLAANGDLLILECSTLNAVRVRRISRSGSVTDFK